MRGSKIDIVRHLERGADQVDLRCRLHQHLHHVESIGDPRIVEQPQPFFCASNDSLLLRSSHAEMRRAERVRGARFDFDKHQGRCITIAANQIDLAAAPCSEVFIKDAEAVTAQISSR